MFCCILLSALNNGGSKTVFNPVLLPHIFPDIFHHIDRTETSYYSRISIIFSVIQLVLEKKFQLYKKCFELNSKIRS